MCSNSIYDQSDNEPKGQRRLGVACRRQSGVRGVGAVITTYWLLTAANVANAISAVGTVGAARGEAGAHSIRSHAVLEVVKPSMPATNSSGAPMTAAESLSSLAWKPVEVLEVGGPIVAAKAKIAGTALLQGTTGTVLEIARGNLAGALQEARAAASQAEEANNVLDAATKLEAWTSVGILAVIGSVLVCWIVEYFGDRMEIAQGQGESGEPVDSKRYLVALNFARYLMSWYVILNNFYEPGEQTRRMGSAWIIFARWGTICTPWFFVLSGFSHTFSLFVSTAEKPDDWFLFMVKKVARWYPLYAVSLTWCALRSWSVDAEDWSHYMAKMLLIEGIIWEKTTFPFIVGDWWLCFLMVYLLVAYPMYHVLSTSRGTVIWTLFTLAFFMCIPFSVMEWFFTGFALLSLVEMYVTFAFGQALATWFVRSCMDVKQVTGSNETSYVMKGRNEIPFLVRFGASFTYLLLGICFFWFSPYDKLPVIRHAVLPLMKKGALLPFFGLQICGLACEYDPVAKVFARAPFRWLDRLAFANFVLQVPIHNTIRDWTGWIGFTWTFIGTLFGGTLVAHFVIERPWQRFLSMKSFTVAK